MSKLAGYVAQQIGIKVTASGVTAVREGTRSILSDQHKGYSLGKLIAGQLPHHYRALSDIAADFASGHSQLEAVLALAACLPDSPSFRNSHCGEITAAYFLEEHLGYRALYRKLTMLTSQNTNAHKMDGLFVNTKGSTFEYLFVEAKTSILPTAATSTKRHKSGILQQMITSLHKYGSDDPRFELSRIRDNLQKDFAGDEAAKIRKDMMPPGPDNLKFLGVSVTNASTVNQSDDDFILTQACGTPFDYYALVVTDLAALAAESYGIWGALQSAVP